MKQRDKIEIAIAGDTNYIVPLTVLLKSLFINNPDLHFTVNFLHLNNGVTEIELEQMESFIAHHGHEMRRLEVSDEQLGKVHETRHSKNTFLRLLLPQLLPNDVTKVLYLDGDVVVNGSIKELYHTNISNVYIAGVKDPMIVFGKEHCRKLGLPDEYPYFNAGIILMNIEQMRKDNVQASFFSCLNNNNTINDQDILNATLYKAVSYLPPIYNFNFWIEKDIAFQLFTKKEVDAALNHPVIIHYIGPVKPWHYKSIHPKKALWWYYLKQTPFKKYRSKDKNLNNFLSYLLLTTIVKPIKPLLTVKFKQKIGKLLPDTLKKVLKKTLFNAQ